MNAASDEHEPPRSRTLMVESVRSCWERTWVGFRMPGGGLLKCYMRCVLGCGVCLYVPVCVFGVPEESARFDELGGYG